MLLGVLFHALVFVYLYQEPASLEEFLGIVFVHQLLHTFRMPAFFMIAGFFAVMLVLSRGGKDFLKNRTQRILLPLLIFWQPMVVLNAYSSRMGWYGKTGYPPPGDLLPSDDTQHLWFLYFLFIFALLVWLIAPVIKRLEQRAFSFSPMLIVLTLAAIGPLIPDAIGRELNTSTRLIPDFGVLLFYFLAFALGGAIYLARETVLPRIASKAFWSLAIGLVSFLVFFLTQDWGVWWSRWAYSLALWMLSIAVLGLFLRFATKESALLRFIADGSYWLYIIHLPIVFFFLVALSEAGASAPVTVLVTTIATISISYLSYKLLVRSTFLGWLLSGRRYPFRNKREITDS